MTDAPATIPYGIADFTTIRERNMAYVDRTRYIHELEMAGRFLFLLRPRRFGKSLTVSMLYSYYDRAYADRFSNLFGGTWIADHPTPERNAYMVLYLNFAEVDPDRDRVETSFNFYTETIFRDLLLRYPELMDDEVDERVKTATTAGDRLSALLTHCARTKQKLMVLIDEYDNFTNTILSVPGGDSIYRDLTQRTGFLRHFFNVLKGGTQRPDSGLSRLFVTGVSPVTLDDVTSGYNIGLHISLEPALAQITGFTRDEVSELIRTHDLCGQLDLSETALLDLMEDWYGGYRFSDDPEPLFNSDMVLYFIRAVTRYQGFPPEMVDHNVRIDYGKLRNLLVVDRRLNGNFSRIRQVLEDGFLHADLRQSFPLERLAEEDNFVSLLHYFGLITPRGVHQGERRFEIPNRTIRSLMFGYLREAYRDADLIQLGTTEIESALRDMAWRGEWRGFFDLVGKALQTQTSIRDYLAGEKVVQGFLLAWLSMADGFLITSEPELNKGFGDIMLAPFRARFPELNQGYLIELKYQKRNEQTERQRERLIEEAREQLTRYAADPKLQQIHDEVIWTKLVVVFHGWELFCVEV